MGKILTTEINHWNGGITNDSRDPSNSVARIISNFDAITNPRKMTPYRDSVSGDSSASTSKKQNFTLALRTGTTYSIYSLGVKSGATTAEVLYKNILTSGTTDLATATWANTANNQSTLNNTRFEAFVYYAKTGLIYGWANGNRIWAYDPSGSAAFDDSSASITYTNVTNGLVHSKDDILYFAYDNNIALKNGAGAWSATALVLPTFLVITSICEYGNYLAIACVPKSGIGNSKVFLWDRDTSLTTVSESIDWGVGSLMVLENIDGLLVGISQKGGKASTYSFTPDGITAFQDRIIFRALNGNQAVKFKELIGGANTTQLSIAKQKVDNRLYFNMMGTFNGASRDGLWSIGRSSPSAPLALIHEYTTNNDTALDNSAGDSIKNFFVIGDYSFISYTTSSGATYALSKTNSTSSYTATSIYESKIFDAGDPSLKKDLLGVTVSSEYLPTAGQVVLKYRTDQNTAFTTIFTNTTDNSISNSVSAASKLLPTDYKEIQFRIESTGGAEITELQFSEEITGKRPY